MVFVKILLIGLVVVFLGYQIYALVRDIKHRRKKSLEDNNKKEKKE